MFVTLSEKAASFPVSTSAMMEYLRAPAEDEALVKRLVARAFAAFEKFTNGRIAAVSKHVVWLDRNEVGEGVIRLPIAPIFTRVSFVSAYDENDDFDVVDAIGLEGDATVVVLGSIPSATREHRGISIEVEAGYSDDTIPDDIILGIEQFVVHAYERRGDVDVDIPPAVARLWLPYVRRYIAGGA